LQIDGAPAYSFQFWNAFQGKWTDETLLNMVRKTERQLKQKVGWVVMARPTEQRLASGLIRHWVASGNSNFIRETTEIPPRQAIDWKGLEKRIDEGLRLKSIYPKIQFGLWAYPGFLDQKPVLKGFARNHGGTLLETLRQYRLAEADFVMLSSWNDWIENTSFEPGYWENNFENSPYYYCHLLAQLKGRVFDPPPLPSEKNLDPLLKENFNRLVP
jgi:hypothetical protein